MGENFFDVLLKTSHLKTANCTFHIVAVTVLVSQEQYDLIDDYYVMGVVLHVLVVMMMLVVMLVE
jgi:hypothetical protein